MPKSPRLVGILVLCLLAGMLLSLNPVVSRTFSRASSVIDSSEPSSKLPNLTGDAALKHLKQNGSYDSLAKAMQAAKYEVNWVDTPRLKRLGGAYEADNPDQGFTAYFTPEGVHLIDRNSDTPAWFLELKFRQIGYGDQLGDVSQGASAVASHRIELTRTSSLISPPLTSAPTPESPALIEWYENRPAGLEHGMLIPFAPGGIRSETDRLRVAFDLDGNLQTPLTSDGQAVEFFDRNGKGVLRYERLKVFDATGQVLPAQIKLESGQVILEVDDLKAVYPITIDPTFPHNKNSSG